MTVGMGPWPMDRLVRAAAELAVDHDVFIQTGASSARPNCAHRRYIGLDEVRRRIEEADVVITHAGNTVRLAQRAGKVPIVVAREPRRGEHRNAHQRAYVDDPDVLGPAVVLSGPLDDLASAVAHHSGGPADLGDGPAACSPAPAEIVDHVVGRIGRRGVVGREPTNPFRDSALRRHAWAWSQIAGRRGRHLELGIGQRAPLLGPLAATPGLMSVAADPHPAYVASARAAAPATPVIRVEVGGRLPFAAASFDSATLLDVLEHTGDEDTTLSELARVLAPGAPTVLTVPARHLLSFLDPDDLKFGLPRLHRLISTARYGAAGAARRFASSEDGLRGDLAWNREGHTNYRAGELIERLADHGLETVWRDGANLLGRLLHPVSVLAPRPVSRVLETVSLGDGLVFHRANLFLLLHRR